MKGWHVIISHEDSVANRICHVSSRLWLFSLHITCPVVFLSFLPQSNLILLAWKEFTSFHFLWKQNHNLFPNVIHFFDFHFKVKALLKA